MNCYQHDVKQAFLESKEVLIPYCDQDKLQAESLLETGEKSSLETADQIESGQVDRISGLPGVLKVTEKETVSPYETVSRSLEEIQIKDIAHFEPESDSVIGTIAPRPMIVRTSQGNFCIDGFNYIEDAQAKGIAAVSCDVDTIRGHSDLELKIRKAINRTTPKGGKNVYAERMFNTKSIYSDLMNSNENLKDFGFGGNRRGEGFISNREHNVRHIISIRLGVDRDTCNAHLNYGDYLTREAFQFFIRERVTRKFFEGVQKKKHSLEKKLEGKGLSEQEIMRQISKWILDTYRDQQIPEEPQSGQTEPAEAGPAEPEDGREEVITDDDIIDHDYIVPDEDSPDPDDHDDSDGQSEMAKIVKGVLEMAARLQEEVPAASNPEQLYNCLDKEFSNFGEFLTQASSLLERS